MANIEAFSKMETIVNVQQYCARRLQRMRKALGFVQAGGPTKQKKLKDEAQLFMEDISILNKDARFLQLLLFQAERAWGYAMELKEPMADDQRKRRHLIGRLKKACRYAQVLDKICDVKENNIVDERSMLEAKAYAKSMTGYYLFEKSEWKAALDHLITARTIYRKLSETPSSTAHEGALYDAMIDELEPNLRFCAYQLQGVAGQSPSISESQNLLDLDTDEWINVVKPQQDGDDFDLEELNIRFEKLGFDPQHSHPQSQQHHHNTHKAINLNSIKWQGHTISLKNQELIRVLLSAQESLISIAQHDSKEDKDDIMNKFDKLIASYNDAVAISAKIIETDNLTAQKIISSKTSHVHFTHQLLHLYCKYKHQQSLMLRSYHLALSCFSQTNHNDNNQLGHIQMNHNKHPTDVVRYLDKIYQSLAEVKRLSIRNEDSDMEVDDNFEIDLAQWVDTRHAYFTFLRYFFIALAFHQSQQYVDAYAIIEQSQSYLTQALVGLNQEQQRDTDEDEDEDENPTDYLDQMVTADELRKWESTVTQHLQQTHAKWAAMTSSSSTEQENQQQKLTTQFQNLDINSNDAYSTSNTVLDHLHIYPQFQTLANQTHNNNNGENHYSPSLTHIPIKMQPVAIKPIVFDITNNEFDSEGEIGMVLERISAKKNGRNHRHSSASNDNNNTNDDDNSQSGRISGIFGSFFGRKS